MDTFTGAGIISGGDGRGAAFGQLSRKLQAQSVPTIPVDRRRDGWEYVSGSAF